MIVSKDINPERDCYYLGAKVIEILANSESKEFDFFEVFQKINTSEKVSVGLFALTLDWLYLIGVLDNLENGGLKKCF